MATMTLNEFVNKLDQPLWEQLIVADKRPGMAITMYALHDIWVDVLVQTLDSDDWQIKKREDMSTPPVVTGKHKHPGHWETTDAGRSKIPKPTGTKPTSNTRPSPGSSASKIPRPVVQTSITAPKVSSRSTADSSEKASRRPKREQLPKVIPKPSLFKKRHPSPFTPYPGRKRSHSRDGWSSSERRPGSSGTSSTFKKRSPLPDPLEVGGGLRERERTPYGGTSAPGAHKMPDVAAREKERHKGKDHTRSQRNVAVSRIAEPSPPSQIQYEGRVHASESRSTLTARRVPKSVSSTHARNEIQEQQEPSHLRTSGADPTERFIPELQDRPRAPYSWTRGSSLRTEAPRQAEPHPTTEVLEASSETEQAETKPVQPKDPGPSSLTPGLKRHHVQRTSPSLGLRPAQEEGHLKKDEAESGTESGGFARQSEKGTPEPPPSPEVEDVVEQIKSDLRHKENPKQQYADPNLEAECNEPEEQASTDSKHTDGLGPESHYTSSPVEEGQGEHKPSTPISDSLQHRKERRSKRTSKSRRGLQPRTAWNPRSTSHWISYYHRPNSPHQDPIWDNSDLWAYFRSLLRVTDDEIYSTTGPENPYFQPLPAPEPAPVGESGPIVPYHELPDRLQPKPVAGKGFVTPTMPFRVGFVTSILDPKVLRQRCLGRRGVGVEDQGGMDFDEGEYAERSKICYPPSLDVELQSDISEDGQPGVGGHPGHGQRLWESEVGVSAVDDSKIGFEHSEPQPEDSGHRHMEAEAEASNPTAGLSHATLDEIGVSEPDSPAASISAYDYAGTRCDETTKPALHEPTSPTACAASLHSFSDDEMADLISSEGLEPTRSEVVESQDGVSKTDRADLDYSDCESLGAESADD
ncbi:hypothetical protein DL546_000811 [Coniochaeta pulveracea]|uniref:Uncharacterized protein n=1 Tax=Coniochaeta pulveracea TaxID=177199 RepID=A0A420YCZ1_9PEZI|nr:hypothetical protein DL546_000811 [Coniochaeta pulveracea]